MNIINYLSEGYRILGRKLYLLAVPVLLDIWLWQMPRLAIGDLLQRFVDFYMATIESQNLDVEIQDLLVQSSENLSLLGERFNLMGLLVSREMMHVPNILVYIEPPLTAVSREVDSLPEMLGLTVLFIVLSMLIGVVYMRMLATRFTAAAKAENNAGTNTLTESADSTAFDIVAFITDSARQWLRIILFFFIMICVLLAFYFPTSFVIIFMMMISPAAGAIGATILSAILFMLFFYLYFATIGMVLDDLAIFEAVKRSFKLIRKHFWASIGMILLIYFITQGIGMLLQQVTIYGPAGIVVAILCNAYVGTGLVLALLYFYRERTVSLDE